MKRKPNQKVERTGKTTNRNKMMKKMKEKI